MLKFAKGLRVQNLGDGPDEETMVSRDRRGLGAMGVVLFALVAAIDVALIHFNHYDPYDRFTNFRSLFWGASPAPVFWALLAADLFSLLLTARLIFACAHAAKDGRRTVTAAVGLPLLWAGFVFATYAAAPVLENIAGGSRLTGALAVFLAAVIAASLALSLFATLAASEGSARGGRARTWLSLVPAAALWGTAVLAGRFLTSIFYLLPLFGTALRAGVNLALALVLINRLSRAAGASYRAGRPSSPGFIPGALAFFSALILLFFVIVVPGPAYHSDSIEPPPLTLKGSSAIYFAESETRDQTVVASTRDLRLVVSKQPFTFALMDRQKRVLLNLISDAERSDDYQGISMNTELKSLPMIPWLGPCELVESVLRLRSSPLREIDSVRVTGREVVAESRMHSQPVAVTFSFYDDQVLRIEVEAGSMTRYRSTSLSFYSDPDERFLGLGDHGEMDLSGQEVRLLAQRRVEGLLSGDLHFPLLTVSRGEGGGPWPVPFVYFSRGIGIFMAENIDGRFELGSRYEDAVRFVARGGPATLYVITGRSPLEIVNKYLEIMAPRARTSPESLLAWATVSADKACRADASELADLDRRKVRAGFALLEGSVEGDCPGLASFSQKARSMGYAPAVTDSTWLAPGNADYSAALKNGYLVMNRTGLPYHFPTREGSRVIIDFTNPDAAAWRAAHWRSLVEAGVRAMILDPDCLIPPNSVPHRGEDGYVLRNSFPLAYAAVVRETVGPDFVLASSVGYAGMERLAQAAWPSGRGEGRTAIPETLGKSMGGALLAGPAPTSPGPGQPQELENAINELAAASMTPLFIIPAGLDPAVLEAVSSLADTHARLLPYFYSIASQENPTPLVYHPILEEPACLDWFRIPNQFFAGGSLMVSASPRPGLATETVRLPPGRWLYLESLEMFEGGDERAVNRKSARPLIFLGEGRVLPAFSGVGRGEDPLAGELTLSWIQGPDGVFHLFDGARISFRQVAGTILFRARQGQPRAYTLRVLAADPARSVTVNGTELPAANWSYSRQSRVLMVTGLTGPELEVVISLE